MQRAIWGKWVEHLDWDAGFSEGADPAIRIALFAAATNSDPYLVSKWPEEQFYLYQKAHEYIERKSKQPKAIEVEPWIEE